MGLQSSPTRYGSFSDHRKKAHKTTSKEQTAYIKRIVARSLQVGTNSKGTFSSPYHRAFE